MKKKKYIPNKKYNPVVQASRIAQLAEESKKNSYNIDNLRKVLETVIESYDKHVEHLANFAQHDMKNAIQSMDSVLYTTDYKEITEDEWLSLKTCLNNIRETFNSFSKLVPYSQTNSFTIDSLMTALDILTRNSIENAKIEAIFDYPKNTDVEFFLPFQSILQMLHNVMLNAMKAVELTSKKCIKLVAKIDEGICKIKIYDSGTEILKEHAAEIFKYKFTTTQGSGIGLYHANYVCEKINGSIVVNLEKNELFTKNFSIEFPIRIKSL